MPNRDSTAKARSAMDKRNNLGGYEEVAVLMGKENVGARITKRESDKGVAQFSFAFFRTFPKGGALHETHWFSKRHLEAIESLIPSVEDRMRKEMGR
jgi:hypothetical protein